LQIGIWKYSKIYYWLTGFWLKPRRLTAQAEAVAACGGLKPLNVIHTWTPHPDIPQTGWHKKRIWGRCHFFHLICLL